MSERTMTMAEFLAEAERNPLMAENAAQRIYRRIFVAPGFDAVAAEDDEQLARALELAPGEAVRTFRAFDDFYGREREIEEIAMALEAAGAGAEQARQIIVWIGETGTGKSALAARFHQLLEGASIWTLKGCPMHEHPFRLLPRSRREEFSRRFNAPIHPTADICHVCRTELQERYEGGHGWERFPVVERRISARQDGLGVGVGVMFPSDPMNEDISELIGRVNIAMLDDKRYAEGHARTLIFNGLFHHAEQGLLEVREIFKREVRQLNLFIFATQEKEVPGPGNYGRISVDCVIIGHSNMAEYQRFLAEPTNEALVSRTLPLTFRHLLRWSAEAKVYEKERLRSRYGRVHVAPHTLETAAKFAVLTRLTESAAIPALVRMAVYNGDADGQSPKTPSEFLLESPKDGREGLDTRFFTKAMGTAYTVAGRSSGNGERSCLLWPEYRQAILRQLMRDESIPPRERERWRDLMSKADEEYMRDLREEFTDVVIGAQEVYADGMFASYVERAKQWFSAGRENEDLERFLAQVETAWGFTRQEAYGIRETLVTLQREYADLDRPFRWQDQERLRRGIRHHLVVRMRDFFPVPADGIRSPDAEAFAEKIREVLSSQYGYCERCADDAIDFVARRINEVFS